MLAIALGGGLWGLSDPHPSRAMARMTAMCFLGLVVFTVALLTTFLPHRGLAALGEPTRIVWFYGISRQGHVHDLMMGLDTGKLRSLPLPHPAQVERGLELLRELAPDAIEGFSEELRLRFKRSPGSLRAGAPAA